MADITPSATAVMVVESFEQCTLITAEAVAPGQAVRIDTTNGRFTLANATTAAEARVYGVAVGGHNIPAGYPVTAVRRGVLAGFTLNGAYDAAVYLSNTDGALADAAGTVSTPVGRVLPAGGGTLGSSAAKLLLLHL